MAGQSWEAFLDMLELARRDFFFANREDNLVWSALRNAVQDQAPRDAGQIWPPLPARGVGARAPGSTRRDRPSGESRLQP
jgi:hypothetical protein